MRDVAEDAVRACKILIDDDSAIENIEAVHSHVGLAVTGLENGHEAMGFRTQRREPQGDDVLGHRGQAGRRHPGQWLAGDHTDMVGFGGCQSGNTACP